MSVVKKIIKKLKEKKEYMQLKRMYKMYVELTLNLQSYRRAKQLSIPLRPHTFEEFKEKYNSLEI